MLDRTQRFRRAGATAAIVLAVATLVVLAVALFAGGRTGRTITIIALVAIALYLILANRWLVIPGVN